MSKGYSGLVSGTKGDKFGRREPDSPVNGVDYNTVKSKSVGSVTTVSIVNNAHNMSPTGQPGSVVRNYRNHTLTTERYYGEDGKAYLDIDYTNHGNPKMHPNVPHEHSIHFENGKLIRDDEPDGGIVK